MDKCYIYDPEGATSCWPCAKGSPGQGLCDEGDPTLVCTNKAPNTIDWYFQLDCDPCNNSAMFNQEATTKGDKDTKKHSEERRLCDVGVP